jgi:hypothetical protein
MALLWLDSFDHYLTADIPAKWSGTAGIGLTQIDAGQGRRSSAALTCQNGGRTVTLPVSGTTAILGVAYKPPTFGNSPYIGVAVLSGATPQLTLTLSTTGFLEVHRGSESGTLLGTASAALTPSVYQFVELKAVIHPSAGAVTVRVNEIPVLTLTSVNTAATGSAVWDGVQVGAMNAGSSLNQYDDLYVLDGSGASPLNDLLGDCRVDARYPTGAGATTAWTPSTGANWQNVDDATPNGDTDYNSTATVGATDTFATQDAPVPGALLYGVQLCLSQKKTDVGACAIAPVVRHSGADYPGTSVNPGTTYAFACTPYGTNPGSGAAWTESGFNAAEFGYKRTA